MIENERVHSVIYFNAVQNLFVERNISNTADLSAVIHEIISSINDNLFSQSPEQYFSENSCLSFASFTYITSSSDHSMLETIDENVDADYKNAVIVVCSPESCSDFSADYSTLALIPVVVGKITASIKDIDI